MSNFNIENIIREEGIAYASFSKKECVIELARRGISKKSLVRIAEFCSLSLKDLAALLPVSLRTLQRYQDDDLLDPHVSERVIQIAEVIEKGMEVFSSRDKLQVWLQTPLLALGQRTPLSLLDTGFGIQMVMDTLGRLEHGVFS